MILDNKGEASLHPTSTPDTEVIQAVDSVAKGIEASSSKFFYLQILFQTNYLEK